MRLSNIHGPALGFVVLCLLSLQVLAQDRPAESPLKVEYIRADIDYSQYDKLMLDDVDVSNTRIISPPWRETEPYDWKITPESTAALQAAFRAAMTEQVSGNDGHPLVEKSGPGVMEMRIRIISFMPYADRNEKVTTRGSGEMQIQVALRDATTNELIAMYEGTQEVGQNYQVNSDLTRQKNLQELFNVWGQRVRAFLDR